MARFMYKVRDGVGELSTGLVSALSLEEASAMLRNDGKFIVKLDEVNEADLAVDAAHEQSESPRVKREDVITFSHQLAVMIDTGVPISEALDCVAEQASSDGFRQVLGDVAEQVQAGGELSAALRSYPKVFPPVMTSLVRASEVSGTMGPMLERISQYLQKEHQTAKKIKGALVYPAIMLLMVTGVTIFLLTFVLPRFAGIYQSKGAALPLPTQILMSLSELLINWWYLIIGVAVAAGLGLFMVIRTPNGRRLFDFLKLHLPVLGSLFSKMYITRSCRTMGTMIAAGVPILDMISIVRQVTNNVFFEDLWDEVDDRLRQGSQLSDALFTSKLIPRSVTQMIYSGEKAGRLHSVMDRIATYTEEDFDEQVKQTTQYIEPAMVAIMGLIIGFIAIALLLPIFSVGRVMAGG